MTRREVGLVLFWIGVIWAVLWGVIVASTRAMLVGDLTMAELDQTIWAFTKPLGILYGFAVPLGAIVAGVGILLYSGAKGSTVWKVGIGVFIAFIIAQVTYALYFYSAPLFGIGGTLILLSFIGILWLWAKERMALRDSSTTAADFRLVGYVFMLIAAWFIWGKAAEGFVKALEGMPTTSMMNILILLALGWVFLFLSHYKSHQQQRSAGPSGVTN